VFQYKQVAVYDFGVGQVYSIVVFALGQVYVILISGHGTVTFWSEFIQFTLRLLGFNEELFTSQVSWIGVSRCFVANSDPDDFDSDMLTTFV
jgi:hypothetical protein